MCIELFNKHIIYQHFKNLPSSKLNPIGPTNAGIYTFLNLFHIRQAKSTVSTLLVDMNVLI